MAEGNINVLADAQFSVARILRPYAGFEADYQGVTVDRQIMCTEVLTGTGGEPLDDQARISRTGYDPALVRGLKVPMGARVLIWLPKILPNNSLVNPNPQLRYKWTLQWRMRNVFDFRQTRTPFHYPKQGLGFPDSSSGVPQSRVVIPAANQTTVYVQSEPTVASATVAQNARVEDITTGGIYPGAVGGLPLIPGGGDGTIEQGILDPALAGIGVLAKPSLYQLIETQAGGDELLVGLWRDDDEGNNVPTWDFGQPVTEFDTNVAILLGVGSTTASGLQIQGPFPDIGVYVMVGAAP